MGPKINAVTGKQETTWQKRKSLKPKGGYCNVSKNDASCKKLYKRTSGGQVSML